MPRLSPKIVLCNSFLYTNNIQKHYSVSRCVISIIIVIAPTLCLVSFLPFLTNFLSLTVWLEHCSTFNPFTSAVHEATRKVRPKYVKFSFCSLLASILLTFWRSLLRWVIVMLMFYAESLSFLVLSWNAESSSLLENIVIVIMY